MRELILDRSDGNPFFVEEIIRSLIDREILVAGGGNGAMRWQVAGSVDIPQIQVPDTLQALLLQRLDGLEAEVRQTLQVASVIGRSFSRRLLDATVDDPALDRQLGTLQRVELIRESAWVPEREYSFLHALSWEAAYSTILRRQRRQYPSSVWQRRSRRCFRGRPTSSRGRSPTITTRREISGRCLTWYRLATRPLSSRPTRRPSLTTRRAVELARLGDAGTEMLRYCYRRLGTVA